LEIWAASLKLWLQRPWLGWGPGTYVLAASGNFPAELQAKLAASNQFVEHPHNFAVFLLVESGILGLAAFGGLLISALPDLKKGPKDLRSPQGALTLALLGLLAENFFDRNLFLPGSALFFFAGTGLLAAPKVSTLEAVTWRWLGLLFLAAALWPAPKALKSFRDYHQATRPESGEVLPEASRALARGLEDQARLAVAGKAPKAGDWLFLGDALAKQGKYGEAVEAYDKALGIDNRLLAAVINRGNCLFQLSRFGESESSYRRAVDIDPASVDAHFDLGYCLFYQRRLKEAVEEFDRVLKLEPGNAKAMKMKEQILN
jgi:tetratricopeptide (TPR) repeat protein